MNIVTIEDANAVNCCPCDWPVCAEPRKECESASRYMSATEGLEEFEDWDRHGLWKPFLRPDGLATDDLPLIYRAFNYEEYYNANFTASYQNEDPVASTLSRMSTYSGVIIESSAPGSPSTATGEITGTIWDDDMGSGGSILVSGVPVESLTSTTGASSPDAGLYMPYEDQTATYTATTAKFYWQRCEKTDTMYVHNPVGPYGFERRPRRASGIRERYTQQELGDSISKESLVEQTLALFPEDWPETPEGTDCYAQKDVNWPVIGSAAWPTTLHVDQFVANEFRFNVSASATIQKARYRMGVPAGYSTPEAPRSTWEMTWDEIYASDAWWAWFDGGMDGEAPDESLALVTARDWTWGGSMESPWSDWYEIPIPETPGQTRVVNVMVVCWKSTRLGYKPTAHGDQVALPA
jgi:hypothetical protein